jgi:glycerol-3-phosphate dehydrogenase
MTRGLPLVGAPGAPGGTPPRLARRYGAEAAAVAAAGSLEPVAPGVPVCEAELRWAVAHELALCPEDLVERRTRAGLVPEWREAAQAAAAATLPGWSSGPSASRTSATSTS